MRARLDRILLFLRTLVWLRPIQIYGRLWFRLYQPRPKPMAPASLRPTRKAWQRVEHPPSMTGPETFTFLNHTETLNRLKDWNGDHLPKLWLYNAHYFDDLNAANAGERSHWHLSLIRRWVEQNPPGTGNGWEPYPTSLRIVNWAKWLLAGNPPPDGMLGSLAQQADWLSRRLEHHLLGNHLFANAKALVFAGCVLDTSDANRFLKIGLRLLHREIPEQILPDGGHFERSIMYHAILTEDVLDLVQLCQMYPDRIDPAVTENWQETAARMLRFLAAMSHPDGRVAFFNDGAFAIAAEPAALMQHAQALRLAETPDSPPVQPFEQSGYTRLSNRHATLLTDTAPIGPDYLPGHAHADTLSFEFSLNQQRIFVNGGTSVYGGDPRQRMRERSTASHNTVCIDNQNSSEIWSDFRVARRAKIRSINRGDSADLLWVEACHDGYRRISGPLHTRRWELTNHSLTIHDRLDRQCRSAKAFFRIHPDCAADTNVIRAQRDIAIHASGGTLTLEDGLWAPEFGKTLPCKVLVLTLDDLASSISFTWEP